VVNLWRSRAQLYRQIHSPLKVTLATWMVKIGMKRMAARTDDPQLKQAYHEISRIWQLANGEASHGVQDVRSLPHN
jgi:hypothetical protein